MPKVPTTIRRRFVSPVTPEQKLHDSFGDIVDVVEVETEEIIKDDHSQTSSTRRKRSMIVDLLRLGPKTRNDTSPSATQTKKKLIKDLLKLGRSDKSKKAADASSSSSSDSNSSDEESAGSSSSQEKDAVEEPEVPAPTLDLPTVHSVDSTSAEAVAQTPPREEVETEMEKEDVTLVDVNGDDKIPEVPSEVPKKSLPEERPSGTEKPVSKESGSADDHSAAATIINTIVTSTDSDSALVSASTSGPTPASIAASIPVPSPLLPAPHSIIAPLPSESTTPAYPFNHFPSAPRRLEGTRRGLRREHGFYHKSHFEIAWVPEFGDRDAPPQTLEEVLPPWDPMFRPESERGSLSAMPFLAPLRPRVDATTSTATAAAHTLPVESASAPAAASRTDEIVMPSVGAISSRTRSRSGTTLKRAREPEPENTKTPAEGRPVRRRRVGLNKAVGA